MSISLCMITKNEEAYLEQCLESVKSLVDEIVIVDTGSTDKTIEIAERFGAKIIKKPWNNDFSEARNESLNHATKDWILVLDADETVSKEDLERIKALTNEDEYMGFMLIQRSYMDKPQSLKWRSSQNDIYEESKPYPGWMYSGITRLFKNNKTIRFGYPVHETVKESIKKLGGKTKKTDIPIHHYGKVRGDAFLREKNINYLELGMKKLEQKPEAKFFYELAVQAQVLGKLDIALENFKNALELNPAWVAVHINLGNIYIKQNKLDEAIKILEEGKKVEPRSSNLANNLGLAYEKLGNEKNAIEEYARSINLNRDNPEPYFNLSRIMFSHGKIDFAIKLLEEVHVLDKNNKDALNNLGALYLQKGMNKEALETFERLTTLNPENKNEIDKIISALKTQGKKDTG